MVLPPKPTCPDELWTMDFEQDAFMNGRKFRTLNLMDGFTREALEIEADTSLPGERVKRVLEGLKQQGRKPEAIVIDNGPEFISQVVDQWAYENRVRLHFITPGRPMENGYIESFNGKFRDECLNEHWFLNLADARRKIAEWKWDYNYVRPHSALGYLTPMEFRQIWLTEQNQKTAGDGGKDAPWKSPTADFSTALGNPAESAGFPLSHRPDDGCVLVTEPTSQNPNPVKVSLSVLVST